MAYVFRGGPFFFGVFVAAAMLVQTSVARADPESEAKDLFARGRELRGQNDCGSAVPLFRKAYAVYPAGLGSLRNVAECEELLGHFASSRRAWLDISRALITMAPDPKYDGWDKEAEDAAARLKPKVASFVVDVYVKSNKGEELATERSGVEIFVNGESVGTTLVGTPLERDPGTYRIRAQTAHAEPVEQIVPLSAGDNPHVTLRLTRKELVEPPREVVDTGKTRRTIGWALVGAGGAALVGGGVTFLIRNGAKGDVDDQCPLHENCDPSLRDTVDRGKTMTTLTNILVPAGVVLAGAGVALVLTAKKPTASASLPSTLTLTPWAGGGSATWRF